MNKKIALVFSVVFFVAFLVVLPEGVRAQSSISELNDILSSSGLPTSTQAEITANLAEELAKIPTPQEIRDSAVGELLEVDMRPVYPAPGERVSIVIGSNLTDLNRADISWSVNGVFKESGLGRTTFSLTAGKGGSVSRVVATIRTAEGSRVSKTITIRPAGIDFMWEADTYTPPFYKGKAMITSGSNVKVSAVPRFVNSDGSVVPTNSIVFIWKKENAPIAGSSGVGRNTITIPAPVPFWESDIEVEASSVGGSFKATKRVDLLLVRPEVVFYEESPLDGVKYERALSGNFNLSGQEVAIRAVPFFFSRTALRRGDVVPSWSLNGATVDESSLRIVLRNEGSAGASRIGLSLRHATNSYQQRNGEFTVNFAEGSAFNF